MGPVLIPPPKYVFPFPGTTSVHITPLPQIEQNYRGAARFGETAKAFSYMADPNTCVLVLPRVEDVGQIYWDALKRHENAHCNGWDANHTGGGYW